jgi:hypothetical protein
LRAAVRDLARILRVPDWAFVTANVIMRFKWRPFVKVVNKVRLAEHPPKSKTLPTKTAALLIARSISDQLQFCLSLENVFYQIPKHVQNP